MRPHLITSSASAWCEAHATPPVELRRQPAPPPASRARPPRASWLAVERPEQHRRLSRSVEHATVTLLRAPAGTGKTFLAADWASRRIGGGDPVAWMTMTERDNDPAVFWAHLREALALLDLSGPETGLPAGVPDAEHLDLLSARLLELGAPVALVVDAADRLRTRTIYDQLRALIEAADDRLRIVITSRTEPPLPIHRYRVEDRLTEFGADDLEQVLLRHRVPASAELIDEVLRRTEGWAVGVRLAALRLAQEGPGVDLAGFAAPYVREEILTELAPIERDVLTATAPVEELAPGLAPALTGRPDGDVVVHALARGNA
ncbi:MAG TPA: hypothetical protein PL137_05660, partial [Nocardioides sp.]|nr:hypothetical protein [Nocardioides sp.]